MKIKENNENHWKSVKTNANQWKTFKSSENI
jgi:hypothetical protein